MKKQLSALEIGYLVKEFQVLVDSKVDAIIHPEKKELLMRFFVPGKGKKLLRILSNFIYLANEKKSAEKPTGFCMALRKYLLSSRLRKIKQVGSERIIELLFETKENKYILLIELFANGNIILCDDNYKVLALIESHIWKDRTLKTKVKYKLPPKKVNFFEADEKLFDSNLDKPLVKMLATDIGLGGVYAEEVCLLAGIDKNLKKLSDKEISTLVKTIKKLVSNKINAGVVYDDKKVLDINPFSLKLYEEFEIKKFDDYNSAVGFIVDNVLKLELEDEKSAAYVEKIRKLDKIIEKQTEKINEVEKNIKDNEKKAELIYNNYKIINEIISQIKEAQKKYSWKEIKEKLKGHKIIKEVNSKDKKVVLELK